MTQTAAVSEFRHEAVLYEGDRGFVDRIAPFVREGIDAGQPTLVMVGRSHMDALRGAIGDVPGLVEYRDMEVVGANPARIIPVWDEFAAELTGRGAEAMRGVGEPIWPGRTTAQLEECHWHEALINQAFADVRASGWCAPTTSPASHRPSSAMRSAPIRPSTARITMYSRRRR